MSPEAAEEKREVHRLVDRLEPTQVPVALGFLQFILADPVARTLASAPLDDEAETDAEGQLVNDARQALEHDGGVSHDDVLREFGRS